MIVLTILLSILALGVLICIHELGHFAMAKAFGVYVNEFAIGMGPKIFSKKKGETTYSLRAIPIGGYVAMYGEGMEEEEGQEISIPKERSLLGIKKWKRAIIMVAGIVMNFVLGYLFFFSNAAFCDQLYVTNRVTVVENSKIEKETEIRTGDYIVAISKVCSINGNSSACDAYSGGTFSDENGEELWDLQGLAYNDEMRPKTKDDTMTISFTYQKEGETEMRQETLTLSPKVNAEDGSLNGWETMGVSSYLGKFRYGFWEAFAVAGKDWVENTTLIFRSIGGLFIGKGWNEVGGVISIVDFSNQALQLSPGTFLGLWGAISVNLAIFNLLPFPGLDGWHFLVIIVESITRKEFPQKVKGIISAVGMILLFGLMIAVTVLDIVRRI